MEKGTNSKRVPGKRKQQGLGVTPHPNKNHGRIGPHGQGFKREEGKKMATTAKQLKTKTATKKKKRTQTRYNRFFVQKKKKVGGERPRTKPSNDHETTRRGSPQQGDTHTPRLNEKKPEKPWGNVEKNRKGQTTANKKVCLVNPPEKKKITKGGGTEKKSLPKKIKKKWGLKKCWGGGKKKKMGTNKKKKKKTKKKNWKRGGINNNKQKNN